MADCRPKLPSCLHIRFFSLCFPLLLSDCRLEGCRTAALQSQADLNEKRLRQTTAEGGLCLILSFPLTSFPVAATPSSKVPEKD